MVFVYHLSMGQDCMIICPDPVTVYCNDLNAVYPPIAVLDCGGTLELTSTATVDICSAEVKEEITRTYTISGGGYTGPECEQVIIVERIQPSDIEKPTDKTAGDALSCTTTAADAEAIGLPEVCTAGQTSFEELSGVFEGVVYDMDLLDADGDGKEDDIALSRTTDAGGFSEIYTSEGGVFSLYQTIGSNLSSPAAVAVVDWDSDGAADDVVFASLLLTAPVEVWVNSNGTYNLRTLITQEVSVAEVVIADIDEDGQENDLVFANFAPSGYNGGVNGYAINTTSAVTEMQVLADGTSSYYGVVASDTDNDGKRDRVVFMGQNEVRMYDISNSMLVLADTYTDHEQFTKGVAVDIDGDGPDDLLLTTAVGAVLLQFESGIYTVTTPIASPDPIDIALFDADLDGQEDDLIYSAIDRVEVYVFDEDNNYTLESQVSFGSATILPIDLNEDGRTDYITGGFFGSVPSARVYNTSTPTKCITLTPNTTELEACQAYLGYVDDVTVDTQCAQRIERTYTYTDWACMPVVTDTWTQIIDIKDKEGPLFNCPSDMVRSTMSGSCMAAVSLPLPVPTDECNPGGGRLDVGTPVGLQTGYQGELVTLPVGDHTIYYTYYDLCGNPTFCTFQLLIEDNDDPIALCHPNLIVTLGADGTAPFLAMTLDGGSFDECDDDPEILIARVDADGTADSTGYTDMLTIDCTDLPAVMVGLQVKDSLGNVNRCMTMVEVQDNYPSTITAPAATSISCTVSFDENNLSPSFGAPVTSSNCPASLTVRDTLVGQVSSCGVGSLVRYLSLLDADGELIMVDSQLITVVNDSILLESDISWPAAVVEFTGTEDLGEPTVSAPSCSDIAVRKEDQEFVFSADSITAGACYKIERTWYVTDLCLPPGSEGGVLRPFEFMQIIKVINNDSPQFTSLPIDNRVICSYAANCDSLIMVDSLLATATDVGTPVEELLGQAIVFDADGNEVQRLSSLDASGTYQIGAYEILYIVEDRCGNFDQATINFEVQSCKLPSPVAFANNVTIGMDSVIITPEYFDASSNHPCGYDITLSFSADSSDQELLLTCDSLGTRTVSLWATDENGRQNSVDIEIMVDADDGVCPTEGGMMRASIYGEILTSKGDMLNGVEVYLNGQVTEVTMAEDGTYAFPDMPTGGSYTLSPQKDTDHLHGVNTLDVVLIQRHILQLQSFDSPYQYIAADVNDDGKVRASDLLELRKLILGTHETLPNNTSYKMIDGEYDFGQVDDPLAEDVPEEYDIVNLQSDMHIDFTAVKVGDVDGAFAGLTYGDGIESRSGASVELASVSVPKYDGVNTRVAIQATNDYLMYGLQAAIEVPDGKIMSISGARLHVDASSYRIAQGILYLSVAEEIAVEVNAGQVLFYVEVEGDLKGGVVLAEMGEPLRNEAYIGSDVVSVDISVRPDDTNTSTTFTTKASPNPWSSSTVIEVITPMAGELQLVVYNARGEVLLSRSQQGEQGLNQLAIYNTDISNSGLIIYEVTLGSQVSRGKLLKVN